MRFVLVAALTTAFVALAGSVEEKVRLTLPPGGPDTEALLSSTWFSNFERLGPIGGPTKGYDLALQFWPTERTLVLLGRIGKDELSSDAQFITLEKPTLKLELERDGHALSWSIDGKTFRAVYIDGPLPFTCLHSAITPGAIGPTSTVVEAIFKGRHPVTPAFPTNRGALIVDRAQELRGALAFALHSGRASPALQAAARAWLADPSNAEPISKFALSARPPEDREGNPLVAQSSAAPAEEPSPKCPLSAPVTSAVPRNLDLATILARLRYPSSVNQKTCAALSALEAPLAAWTKSAMQTGPEKPAPAPGRVLISLSCAPFINALAQQQWQFARFLGAPAVLESYERELLRCGHIDERDVKCERALLASKKIEWARVLEAQRLRRCTGHTELLGQLERCLEQWTEPYERRQVLAVLAMMPAGSKAAFCPPDEPKWPEPRER